ENYRPATDWHSNSGPVSGEGFALVLRQEAAYAVLNMGQLLRIQAVVAGQEYPAPHYLIGFGVSTGSCPVRDMFKAGLAQNVAGKHGAGLNITLLQKDLEIPAGERCSFFNRQREG